MPEGKHNLHLRFANEFNKLVEDFLQWKCPRESVSWAAWVSAAAASATHPMAHLPAPALQLPAPPSTTS